MVNNVLQEGSTTQEIEGVKAIDINDNDVKPQDEIASNSQYTKLSRGSDAHSGSQTKELVNKLKSVKAANSLSSCSSQAKSKTKQEISKVVEDTRALLSKAKVTRSKAAISQAKTKDKVTKDEKTSQSMKSGKIEGCSEKKALSSTRSNKVFTCDSSFPGMDIRYRDKRGQKEHRQDLPVVTATSQRIEVGKSS